MASPREALDDGLARWWRDEARERIARWRDDPDASPREAIAARHAWLRGPRAREAFEEASERGIFEGDERDRIAAWLRRAVAAPYEDRARARVAEALSARVPHDSDHHALSVLLHRAAHEPRAKERRALERSIEDGLRPLREALDAARADREEARERAAWLPSTPPEAPASREVPTDGAEAPASADAPTAFDPVAATDDAWAELRERLAHAGGAPIEGWADLAFALRAPHLDGLVRARDRWRRLAEGLAIAREPLRRAVHAEPSASTSPIHGLAIVDPSRDVRVRGAAPLGVQAEREAAIAVGRAFVIVTAHPALPEAVARPLDGSLGHGLGALFAHAVFDPAFVKRDTRETRAVGEVALALELATVRLAPASTLDRARRDHDEAALEILARALGVEPSPLAAGVLAHALSSVRCEAAAWAPALHVAMREQLDEDWWRNPRAEEALRAACARGDVGLDSLVEGLGARADMLAPRVGERLG